MENLKLKVNAAGLLLVFCGVALSAELNVTKIEGGIEKLKKSMDVLQDVPARPDIRIKRDPFVSLLPSMAVQSESVSAEEETNQEAEEIKREPVSPAFRVSGIVFDSKMPLAIIGTEVKKEGDFVGEFEVHRIEKDKVLVKHGEDIFTLPSPLGDKGVEGEIQ